MAGPCVVESQTQLETVAKELTEISERLPVDFVFKASYRKANRTGAGSFTGIGDQEALKLLAGIKQDYGLPIVTDVHDPQEVEIFSRDNWWKKSGDEVVRTCVERFNSVC